MIVRDIRRPSPSKIRKRGVDPDIGFAVSQTGSIGFLRTYTLGKLLLWQPGFEAFLLECFRQI